MASCQKYATRLVRVILGAQYSADLDCEKIHRMHLDPRNPKMKSKTHSMPSRSRKMSPSTFIYDHLRYRRYGAPSSNRTIHKPFVVNCALAQLKCACYVVCAHFGMLSPSSLCFFPVSAARDISDLGEKRSLFVSRLFKGANISAYMAKILQSAITLPCNGADKSEIWAL